MIHANFDIMDPQNDKFKDECGVFGVYANEPVDVASVNYYGLYALQHRGQESTGIAVSNGEEVKIHKGLGIITEAFTKENLDFLKGHNGNIAIGHVRYSTAGAKTIENSQPLLSTTKLGQIATAHNGNLVNYDVIRELLEEGGHVFNTTVDSEVITTLIARGAKKGIERAVIDAISAVRGSFAMVIMSKDKLIGVRDPHGIRPLCIGKIAEGYILSSESCAIDAIGGELIRDVRPGEIVIIDENGIKSINYSENTTCRTCSFEYIYFARPDSVMDGIDVHTARVRQGEQLFKEYPIDADLVIAVPDSGIPAALGYSRASGIPYDVGFVKNRYVGRTFIKPKQEQRESSVKVKLNVLKEVVAGKRVIMIDDSIVRGTTSSRIINLLRQAGAKEVHVRISSPAFLHPCYFGTDIPSEDQLIASGRTVEQICDEIGADSLGYLETDKLSEMICNQTGFCDACFTGNYPIEPPTIDIRGEMG